MNRNEYIAHLKSGNLRDILYEYHLVHAKTKLNYPEFSIFINNLRMRQVLPKRSSQYFDFQNFCLWIEDYWNTYFEISWLKNKQGEIIGIL